MATPAKVFTGQLLIARHHIWLKVRTHQQKQYIKCTKKTWITLLLYIYI
uniref:Uncharacterized protein n=1 Tax=Anguilla anguilla TaxID=7936 RepID=A0A0E9WAF2_ANGAN